MAVQAQYLPDAFSPDFSTRIHNNNMLLLLTEELEQQNMIHNNGGDNNNNQLLIGSLTINSPLDLAAFNSSHHSTALSDLTCAVASGSRKRIRVNEPAFPVYPNPLDLQSRLLGSADTSTSGRSPSSSSPLALDLFSHLYQHNADVDALIRYQNERLRLGLEQAHKKHCRAVISAVEHQVINKLREKDVELETASRINAELEEKVRQMVAENQIWFNIAKNNEAIVSNLKLNLEQILSQHTAVTGAVKVEEEGYGDSEGTAMFPADDATSCCFDGGAVKVPATEVGCRKKCKVCGDNDVSVLLLPCRHLCLCKDCESKTDTCPVCHVSRRASLQIFMS